MHLDGSSNSIGSGAGLIYIGLKKTIAEYALHFEFPATNNEIEYEALIVRLKISKELKVRELKVYSDS